MPENAKRGVARTIAATSHSRREKRSSREPIASIAFSLIALCSLLLVCAPVGPLKFSIVKPLWGALVTVPVWIVIAALLVFVRRGNFGAGRAALLALSWLPAWQIVKAINITLDSSVPTTQEVRYVRFQVTRRGGGQHVVTSWRPPGETFTLDSVDWVYPVEPGGIVYILTRAGFLGIEWVESALAKKEAGPSKQ